MAVNYYSGQQSSVSQPYQPWAVLAGQQVAPATPIPVPTPNPSGSAWPSTTAWDFETQAPSDQPSWDWNRQEPYVIPSTGADTPVQTSQPPQQDQSREDQLVNKLVTAGGYSETDARNAAKTNFGSLWTEFMEVAERGKGSAEDMRKKREEEIRATEQAALGKAQREWDIVDKALSGQLTQAGAMVKQQKGYLSKEEPLAIEGAKASEKRELATIEKEGGKFKAQVGEWKQELGRNFRDLSLYWQRIARARNWGNSSAAQQQEGDLLQQFNAGLTQIAKKSLDVAKDFSNAVIETKGFWERKAKDLGIQFSKNRDAIDNWLRTEVTRINTIRETAASDKSSMVQQAVLQAQKASNDLIQATNAEQLKWDAWLMDVKMALYSATSKAATGSTASAKTALANLNKIYDKLPELEEQGIIRAALGENGLVYKIVPAGTYGIDEDLIIPTVWSEAEYLQRKQLAEGLKVAGPLAELGSNLSMMGVTGEGLTGLKSYTSAALTRAFPTEQPEEETSGRSKVGRLLDTVKGAFKR